MTTAKRSKWWGWGSETARFPVEERPGLLKYLRERFGVERFHPCQSFDLHQVQIPESRMPPDVLAEFRSEVGAAIISTEKRERVYHSCGKSYRDLIRMRSGRLEKAPDVVFFPGSEEDIKKIYKLCHKHRVGVVPFGGGTSVVGGVDADQGDFRYLAALNTTRLNQILVIDEESQTATVEAGMFGPELERALNEKGYICGHYPQSFEFSTLGGWIAARSSGQNSLLYGGIDKLVVALKMISPVGEVKTLESPSHACGPDIKQMVIGSEGICGVITQATIKIHRKPKRQHYFMVGFKSFSDATKACRELIHQDVVPALIRVSDEEETQAMLAMGQSAHGIFRHTLMKAFNTYLSWRGFSLSAPMAVVLIGLEGSRSQNRFMRRQIRRVFSRFSCVSLGTRPGKKWLKERFFLPYVRDELMQNRLFVETLETATTWSNLPRLYDAVRTAISSVCARDGVPCVVYTHISHLYQDGASLYFSILAGQRRGEVPGVLLTTDGLIGQWKDIKEAANRAIFDHHGVISHHHGVGVDHKKYLWWGAKERNLVAAIKRELDPEGMMNPGKLL